MERDGQLNLYPPPVLCAAGTPRLTERHRRSVIVMVGFLRVEGRKDDLYLFSDGETCIHGDGCWHAAAGRRS
ncbi:hypothetical protein KCP76_12195 [Salmonella enterica subsp. enterica serovar Weltevreden]|nr:hypothetical protein KCP76_12195 [Salmonella enterica subsp. enterica serovar Weltevreden]